jgi:hypothetical protein
VRDRRFPHLAEWFNGAVASGLQHAWLVPDGALAQ